MTNPRNFNLYATHVTDFTKNRMNIYFYEKYAERFVKI